MNIAIGQSGGPTCAINASLLGAFLEGTRHEEIGKLYGAKNGIDGVINGHFCDLGEVLKSAEDRALLRLTPSTALGSCRIKLPAPEEDSEVYQKIFHNLARLDIGAFLYIGGNDSMDTVDKLSRYAALHGHGVRFIGVPKTIDNDVAENDHTPGFGSAVKYLVTTIKEIICDSNVYNLPSVTVIEIMGRDSGWLTASTVMLQELCAGAPHLIYLPESHFEIGEFLQDIREQMARHKAVIVAVSEGLRGKNGEYTAKTAMKGKTDNFGHQYLSGLGKYLEGVIQEGIGCKVRSIELNVCQRCASHIASETDLAEAEAAGAHAVRAVLRGESGKAVVLRREDNPYRVEYGLVPVEKCANKERKFPTEWINDRENNVRAEAVGYFLPLIQGEVDTVYKNGIPCHLTIADSAFSE